MVHAEFSLINLRFITETNMGDARLLGKGRPHLEYTKTLMAGRTYDQQFDNVFRGGKLRPTTENGGQAYVIVAR